MKITAIVRQERLTSFNRASLRGAKNFVDYEYYPIAIVVRYEGSSFYITTTLLTTNKDMQCPIFTDKDKTEIENLELTSELKKLIQSCWDFIKEHLTCSPTQIKRGLQALIQGDETTYSSETLVGYIINKVIPLKNTKSTQDNYRTTAKHIRDYDGSATFRNLDKFWLKDFENHLRGLGLSLYTIHMQLRNLRATVNQAIADGDTDIRNPFTTYKMPKKTAYTPHLTLSAQQIADFRDYPVEPWQQRYKDFCLLSFYLAGINPIDILQLKTLTGGRVVTTRQKTGAPIDLPVCEEAKEILQRYKGERMLVSFAEKHKNVRNFIHDCVQALKTIGYCKLVPDKRGTVQKHQYMPMFPDATIYTFRRSFATICAELDVPTENIATALAHKVVSPYAITEVYIMRNKKKADNAVNTLMEYLRTLKGRSKEVIDQELQIYNATKNDFFS